LAAGTYWVDAQAIFVGGDHHKLRWYNTSDSALVHEGFTQQSIYSFLNHSAFVRGIFTISASKTFELQYQVETSIPTEGMGKSIPTPGGGGWTPDHETYAIVKLVKLPDASGSAGTPLTADDKGLVASVTSSDGDAATASTVTNTPFGDGYLKVEVNGIGVEVGDGVKTKDCYFSADSGTTAKAIASIAAGDTLHWNGTVAGFELKASDAIDFFYQSV